MNRISIAGAGMATAAEAPDASRLVCLAGDRCFSESTLSRSDIDLIIFTGVYREKNVGEPAIASLFQRALNVNNDPLANDSGKATFSFDLLNGPAGFINAVQVADSFFKVATYQKALIISGDIHPSGLKKEDFPYSTVYTALLLEFIENRNGGFNGYLIRNYESGEDQLYTGLVDFQLYKHLSRHNITIASAASYRDELISVTADTIIDFMQSNGLKPQDLNHLIISQPDCNFHLQVCRATGVDPAIVIDIYKIYGDPHSASLSTAYILGIKQKLFKRNDHILFVAAGAGLTVACSLYSF